MVEEQPTPRPRPVTVALWLMVASWIASAALSVSGLFSSSTTADESQAARWLALVLLLAGYAVAGGLIAALVYRRRWAWWVWLVLFVLGLPYLWSGLQDSLAQGGFTATRYVLLTAAEVGAAVLLLSSPSRQWFGVGRRSGKPSPWRWSDNPKEP
jgi:hypothetical protein